MLRGYVRVSTAGQEADLQVRALRAAGVLRPVVEVGSGAGLRPKLEALLSRLQPGEVVVVYKVDRAARSLRDLLRILADVSAAGASFRSLTEPIDTCSASGRLLVQLLGAFAEFERSMIRERCDAGRVAAVARGVRFGRPPLFDLDEAAEIARQVDAGRSVRSLALQFGCDASAIRNAIARARGKQKTRLVAGAVPGRLGLDMPPESGRLPAVGK